MKHTNDPLEQKISKTLDSLKIEYNCPDQMKGNGRLDFYLPFYDIYIECKAHSSPRLHEQINGNSNVIVLIGEKSVNLFCNLLRTKACV